ncbi:MAG: ATP-binding domain-containing protein [Planctomycetota bacterium]
MEDHEPAELIKVLQSTVAEDKADVMISTAHKAKGRQWPTVRIANDFPIFTGDNPPLLRLAYVAATRAQETGSRLGSTLEPLLTGQGTLRVSPDRPRERVVRRSPRHRRARRRRRERDSPGS